MDAMSENKPFYCYFLGTQYIICDCGCGHAFHNEEALKDHIETVLKTEPHHELKTEPTFDPNQELTEITEYKCGECGNIYNTEEECIEHQDVDHVPMEEVVYKEEHTYLDEDHPYEVHSNKDRVLKDQIETVLKTEPHHELKTEPTFGATNQEFTEITEYKCGECGNIYNTEEECIEHQDVDHVPMEAAEEVVYEEEHTYLDEDHPYEEHPVKVEHNDVEYGPTKHAVKVEHNDVEYGPTKHAVKVEHNDVEYGPTIKLEQEVAQAAPNLTDIKVTAGGGKNSPTKNKLSKLRAQDGIPIIRDKGMTMPEGEDEGQEEIKILRGQKIKRKRNSIKKKKYYYNKRVICEVCEKTYPSQAALRYHQRVHTGVRPYQCTYCPKSFTIALFLQVHTRTHTGERPYVCKLCPKAFTNKTALNRHDRVHTGEKPYACPECGKCFTQSNSMKLHVHTVHLKLPEPYKSQRRRGETAGSDLKGKGGAKKRETKKIPDPIDAITDCHIDTPNTKLKSMRIAVGSRSGKTKTGVSSSWVVQKVEEIPCGSLNYDSQMTEQQTADCAFGKRSRLLPGMRMVKRKEIPKEDVSSNSCSTTPEEEEVVYKLIYE